MWDFMKISFLDEMTKIADIQLHGLSPQTVLNAKQPEPMETPGLDKARRVLQVADTLKTASEKTENKYKKIRDEIKPILTGMGAGGMLSILSLKPGTNVPVSGLKKTVGAALGGTIGYVDHKIIEDLKKHESGAKEKKSASMVTPAMLKAKASKVGKLKIKTGPTGPTIKQQIPKVTGSSTL